MNKFEYGQQVLHNKTDLAVVVDQDDENTYKIIPNNEYEWVYADADRLEPVSDWIPCSERMPPLCEDIIALDEDGYIYIDAVYSENYECAVNFTHWMPLPTLPK